ncbi:tol-pal system protein YbgF [Methylothermus subterraneus]
MRMRRLGWIFGLGMAFLAQAGEKDLEARVQILEQRLSSRALVELVQQLDQLQEEIKLIRGQLEEMQQASEDWERRYADLEARLRRLEGAPAPATPQVGSQTPPESAAPGPSEAPAEQPAPALPEDPQQAYQKAYETLQAGLYDEAILAFSAFLKAHPDSEQAGDAWYWLGEAYYVKRDFVGARQAFEQVIERFPDHAKAPDALLKLGYVAIDLGDWQAATHHLNAVIERFPGTRAAELARERLGRIQSETAR